MMREKKSSGWRKSSLHEREMTTEPTLKERLVVNGGLLGEDGKLTEAGRQAIAGRWPVPAPTRR